MTEAAATVVALETLDDLIGLWPSVAEWGREIGIKPSHAATIKVRGKLPVEYWPGTISAAAERAKIDARFKGVTSDALLKISTNQSPPGNE